MQRYKLGALLINGRYINVTTYSGSGDVTLIIGRVGISADWANITYGIVYVCNRKDLQRVSKQKSFDVLQYGETETVSSVTWNRYIEKAGFTSWFKIGKGRNDK